MQARSNADVRCAGGCAGIVCIVPAFFAVEIECKPGDPFAKVGKIGVMPKLAARKHLKAGIFVRPHDVADRGTSVLPYPIPSALPQEPIPSLLRLVLTGKSRTVGT